MLNIYNLTQKFEIIYFDASIIILSYFFKNSSSIIVFLYCTIIDEIETIETKIEKKSN